MAGHWEAGTPDELWAHPADAWTARFLGMRNIETANGRPIVVRPEAVRVSPGSGARVVSVERRGAVVWLRIRSDEGRELDVATTSIDHPRPGTSVAYEIDPRGIVELDN